jgi:hypothetical protein
MSNISNDAIPMKIIKNTFKNPSKPNVHDDDLSPADRCGRGHKDVLASARPTSVSTIDLFWWELVRILEAVSF